MLRQGARAPDFPDAAALRAHYRAVETRLLAPTTPTPSAEAEAARAQAEREREALQREADRRVDAALAERARLDALVFQVLDPEELAREPRRVIARVAAAFGLTPADIVGRDRTAAVVRARFAAIAAVREARPELSLPRLGRIFGRDHTTILHAVRCNAERGVPQPPESPVASDRETAA